MMVIQVAEPQQRAMVPVRDAAVELRIRLLTESNTDDKPVDRIC